MSKLGPKNPLLKRVLIIIICIFFICIIAFIIINKLLNQPSLTYTFKDLENYSDVILNNYDDYKQFTKMYNIKVDLRESDFNNNSYIASFQEYDKCSERKIKTPEVINIKDTISITYKVYNKCGWCRSVIMLYLIKTEIINTNTLPIEYDYIYDKTLDCGSI